MIEQDTALDLSKLDKPVVAVVQLRTQPKGVLHQVTLDPSKVHQRSQLIRLGESSGDEANGWLEPENIIVRAVLGIAVQADGKIQCVPVKEAA